MKRIALAILVTGAVFSSTFTSLAAWEQVGGQWKYKDDTTNVYVTATWIESASEAGLWYYIKDDGIMATNAWIDGVYYVNEAGEWREGQTDGNNQGDIDKSKAHLNMDDWDEGGGLSGWSDEELALWEEALNKIR